MLDPVYERIALPSILSICDIKKEPYLQLLFEPFVYYSPKFNSIVEHEWNKEGLPDLWQTSQLRMESVLGKSGTWSGLWRMVEERK